MFPTFFFETICKVVGIFKVPEQHVLVIVYELNKPGKSTVLSVITPKMSGVQIRIATVCIVGH